MDRRVRVRGRIGSSSLRQPVTLPLSAFRRWSRSSGKTTAEKDDRVHAGHGILSSPRDGCVTPA